jgi:CRISPR-associated endonuclease Cas1
MAATETVAQLPQFRKPSLDAVVIPAVSTPSALRPRRGVITLYGYGIGVRVDRGHLVIEDGIGSDRHQARLPRAGHGLERLVVIGSDGNVSLSALRWLADQNAAFVMLDRDGSVLATTGPVRSSDARLRRAQALAAHSGADLVIARELISHKLAGQERVAREKLHDSTAAQAIANCRLALAETDTLDHVRFLESSGAAAYWAAWRDMPVLFPKKDLPRVPEHWRTFATRKSLLSGSQRLATNPVNAMLNYLYAVLESEARLAAAALGLDPGLAFIHMDTPARDSLACDLMEPVRPLVDAYVLDWIAQQPLSRASFFENRDGNCRLMAEFAVRLTETAPVWARAVAPFAEWIARALWSKRIKPDGDTPPPTRLTQRHKREAKGKPGVPRQLRAPRPQNVCRGCGKPIRDEHTHCAQCAVDGATARLADAARLGRLASRTPQARAKQGATQRKQCNAQVSWSASSQPQWLTENFYSEKIQPLLARASTSAIARNIGISRNHAARIRKGYRPHPRHWVALAQLVGFFGSLT